VEMQITKEDFQRKISMQFWSLGESNILIRVRRPPEDAGTAILKVGGKIWPGTSSVAAFTGPRPMVELSVHSKRMLLAEK
jgi:hypothetical protein